MNDDRRGRLLWLRALLSFLALPGVFTGFVPQVLLTFDDWRIGCDLRPIGAVVLCGGLLVLLWCVRDFFVSGRGTLAPWDPPRHLVVVGLYRFVRNPMYLGVLTTVSGQALLFGSPVLAAYVVLLASAFHASVILYEEPTLRRMFGQEFDAYLRSVPRWLPGRARRHDRHTPKR